MITTYVRQAIFTSFNRVVGFVFSAYIFLNCFPLLFSPLESSDLCSQNIFGSAPFNKRNVEGEGVESSFVFWAKPSHFVNLYRWWRPSPASQESRKWTRHLFLRPACFIIHVTLPPPPPKWLQKLIFFPFTWMHFLALSFSPLLAPDCLVPSSFFHYPESLLL